MVQFANSWMLVLTDFSEQEIVGNRAFEVLQTSHEWEILHRIQRRLKGIPGRYETYLLRKEGSSFWAEVNEELLAMLTVF